MKRKTRRLWAAILGLSMLAAAAALVLTALDDNLAFFYSPSDLADRAPAPGETIRVGGLVEEGSVARDGLAVAFRVTDTAVSLPVRYAGALPDLFREGQGIVAEGRLGADGVFTADTVLAKHDETYMPPEVADAIERANERAGAGAPAAGTTGARGE